MTQAIYIHIPFCSHICYYCDFNKVYLEGQPVDAYVNSLIKEMHFYQEELRQEPIKSIYFGGGTPSTLTCQQIERLFRALNSLVTYGSNVEVTFEMNPNDVTFEKLTTLHACGVNRLSLGVQSFDDALLKKIGREHNKDQALRAIQEAKVAGFRNISLDLMFALPTQTIEIFEQSLNQALALNLPHYSIYSLILEHKTIFYNLMRQGKLPLPSQDVEADMFELAIGRLKTAGYDHYEISNYAKLGFESCHNLKYWANAHYFGFGAGAHGYLDGVRYQNHGPIQHYLAAVEKGSAVLKKEKLSLNQRIEEEMFLGLRRRIGVNLTEFKEKFNVDLMKVYGRSIAELEQTGLIEIKEQRIKLTHHGLFLGNTVFQAFLIDK